MTIFSLMPPSMQAHLPCASIDCRLAADATVLGARAVRRRQRIAGAALWVFAAAVLGLSLAVAPAAAQEPLAGANRVAAGGNPATGSHTCALVFGSVLCWGRNFNGQLGDGTTVDRPVPVLAIAQDATALAAGDVHSCAIVKGGLKCWGGNASGQLGNGATGGDVLLPTSTIAADSGVTAVSAGSRHTCAVVKGGVQCWGDNADGQLGTGTIVASAVPVWAIARGSGATAVAAGSRHTCAVIEDGAMKCWGRGVEGQLGNGYWVHPNGEAFTGSVFPIPVFDADGSPTMGATMVVAGLGHTCALVNGVVECWGSGPLGNGVSLSENHPVATTLQSGITALASGSSHVCAVVNGGVQCWGVTYLGYESYPYAPTLITVPTDVRYLSSNSGATAVAGGALHSCAVVNDGVQCWGDNTFGELGHGGIGLGDIVPFPIPVLTGPPLITVTPAVLRLLPTVVDTTSRASTLTIRNLGGPATLRAPTVAAEASDAPYGSFAISATTCGDTLALGASCTVAVTFHPNEIGEFRGTFSIETNAAPSPHTASIVGTGIVLDESNSQGPLTGVRQVAAGYHHTCAVVFGTAQCWGDNFFGQIGDGTNLDRPLPYVVIPTGATAVAAGDGHSCAVVDGGVKCWGNNFSGQLGNGTTTDSGTPVSAIPANSAATAVAAGGGHTCAAVNGGVKCWGDNAYGQLGNSTLVDSKLPVSTIAAGSGVTAVAASEGHTCAAVNGGVKCWGSGANGQLGNGGTTGRIFPVWAIQRDRGVTSLAVAASSGSIQAHSCAVDAIGVRCWGWNDFGQLGDGTNDSALAPITIIPGGSNPALTGVAAGAIHSCAAVNGGVKCWGTCDIGGSFCSASDQYGQLGDGTGEGSSTPVDAIPAASGATSVAAGAFHSCAIVGDGLQCWGDDTYGQLGDGGYGAGAQSLVPVTVMAGPPPTSPADTPPAITVTPAVYHLTATPVGTTSQPATLTIANVGGTAATLGPPMVTSGFSVSATTCGSTLGGGASCTISVTYLPTQVRVSVGSFSLASNATGSPHTVVLVGTGIEPVAGAFTLMVAKAGTGLGTVTGPGISCGADCTERYPAGTNVTLAATTPFAGSSFAGWGGACVGTGACMVTMSDTRNVTANFSYVGSAYAYNNAQQVFVAYYGRPGDPEGLAYWAGRSDAEGGSLAAIINAFGNAAEFSARYGGLSNTALVTKVYQQTLARDPDPAGLSYYVGELQAGRRTLQSITLDVLNGATTPPDSRVVANKLNVAAYYSAKVVAGCAYGTEQDGVNALSGVNASSATVTAAKAGIDSRCGP